MKRGFGELFFYTAQPANDAEVFNPCQATAKHFVRDHTRAYVYIHFFFWTAIKDERWLLNGHAPAASRRRRKKLENPLDNRRNGGR